MYHLYASLILTLVMLILAVLYWRSDYQRGIQTSPRPHFYLLAYTTILVLAIIVPTPVSTTYKAAILLGLILTLLGTVARLFLKAPPVLPHAIDLLVTLLYVATFAAHHASKWPTPWLLVPLILAAGLYLLLCRQLAEMHSTLILYGAMLWLLSWQVLEVVTVTPSLWSWSAVGGVVGFILVKATVTVTEFGRQPKVPTTTSMNGTSGIVPAHKQPTGGPMRARVQNVLHRLLLGLTNVAAKSENVIQRMAATLRFQRGAEWLAAAAPFLILLYQWLLVLSIWGPDLRQYIGRLP